MNRQIRPGLTVIGSCSNCGGPVTVHDMWMSILPDIPTCQDCGATAAMNGPVIPMNPPGQVQIERTVWESTNSDS